MTAVPVQVSTQTVPRQPKPALGMSPSNEPFKPPTSPPPPINWATKPRRATATTDGQWLIPVFIDPDRLSEFIRLGAVEQLEERAPQDGCSPSYSEDLASTLSHLSVTAAPSTPSVTISSMASSSVPLRAATPVTPPMFILSSQRSPSKLTSGAKRKRYYVVTIGRCAGVFYDFWDNVKPLIEFVSGAQYQSFPTHAEAVAAYQHRKAMGLVRIVRDPGDEDKYGPDFYAVQ